MARRDDDSFRDFVLDQLHLVGGLACRRLFSGYGVYSRDTFFAIINDDTLYFKTDEKTRAAYVDAGMGPFRPNEKQTLKTYYQVPVDVLEDDDRLAEWARRAIAIGSCADRAS